MNEVNAGLDLRARISDRTVRRLTMAHCLHSRKAAFKPLLTDAQKVEVRKKKYLKKDLCYWGYIIFSDETKSRALPY